MLNYYKIISDELEIKISKVSTNNGNGISNIERSLRDKKCYIENERQFHQKSISDSYPDFEFDVPPISDLYEYVNFYKINRRVEFINPTFT